MGLLSILTIIFVLLKAFEVIGWSWVVVFIPAYIIVALVVIELVIFIITTFVIKRNFDKF